MKQRSLAVICAIALGFLSVTATAADEIRIDDPNHSLVFGYIDMSDAPTKVKGAWLQQIRPIIDAPYRSMGVEDGLFYNIFIPPGIHQISSFVGSGALSGVHEYQFSRQGRNETAVEIKTPGIYFLGSFKYIKVKKTGMFQQRKFSIERVDEPAETELLERLLTEEMRMQKSKQYKGPKRVKMKDTVWAEKIQARLAELQ
ncbi:MAG: hypothetical protein MJA83_10655 [Gammaproteobacteria bacterium]|nr:hypothetical protein [Gammaproteobacteria bacterium]